MQLPNSMIKWTVDFAVALDVAIVWEWTVHITKSWLHVWARPLISIFLHSPDVFSLSCHRPVACSSQVSRCRQVKTRLLQSSAACWAAPAPPARNTFTWYKGFWWMASCTIATASGENCSFVHHLLLSYSYFLKLWVLIITVLVLVHFAAPTYSGCNRKHHLSTQYT